MTCQLLYLEDLSILNCTAKVIEVDEIDGKITLNKSPFYPQGGGQQSDTGFIRILSKDAEKFTVTSIKTDPADGKVWHYILRPNESLKALLDSEVECQVDQISRYNNSRSHSAGHTLDHAIEDLNLPLQVRGAYHFLISPYVDYEFTDEASIPSSKAEFLQLAQILESKANEIINENIPITIFEGSIHDIDEWRQNLLPQKIKETGRVRLIKFGDTMKYLPVPCSGTHIKFSGDIKPIKIRKISQPYKNLLGYIRVGYNLL